MDLQTLHDFVEDYMASPVGMANDSADPSFLGDILKPEGKIEDPSQPGVFSQIILALNSEWQIQFWPGSGYTRVFGGKLVGGVTDQPIKATGTAGDITVLESPVDGLTIATPANVTPTDLWDMADGVETGVTPRMSLRLLCAVLAGKLGGATPEGGTITINAINGGKIRVQATTDADGNRTINLLDMT